MHTIPVPTPVIVPVDHNSVGALSEGVSRMDIEGECSDDEDVSDRAIYQLSSDGGMLFSTGN